MNPTLANQLLFELMVFKSKTDADKLCTRKRELCGGHSQKYNNYISMFSFFDLYVLSC